MSIGEKTSIDEKMIVNVMVCGKAGVGKTVLINHLVGAEAGKTGIGKPVTTDITSYTVPGSSLICYDTPGFEIKQGQVEKAIEDFYGKIKELQTSMDGNKMIDAVLYCVCYQGAQRFETDETKFIAHLSNDMKIPVYIIFTQYSNSPAAWDNDAYHQKVAAQLTEEGCVLRKNHFCPVLCYEMSVYDGKFTIPAYGLDKLVELIFEEAPMNRANKIANAKISSLDDACEAARKWVIFYSGLAAAEVAAIALPGFDIAALATNETVMARHIYDIVFKKSKIGDYDKERVVKVLSELAVPLIGSIGGPVVFNEAVKFLATFFAPATGGLSEGAAVLAGAAVGFGITYSLGSTTVDIFKKLATGSITIEQLETKDPKTLAEVGKIAKEQYEVGRKYAKEHPEQIRKKK